MAIVKADIRGIEHINDVLSKLGRKVANKALQTAVEKGAEPIVEEAKAKAPVLKEPTKHRQPGELRDSIVADVTVNKRRGSARARIGPKRTEGAGQQDPGCWGLMEEFGSVHNPAQPYLRPAYDSQGDAAVQKLAQTLKEAVEQAVSELGGK